MAPGVGVAVRTAGAGAEWPAGYRKTRQREAVVAALRTADGGIDLPELHRRARRQEARLSLSTVYRTVAELRGRGLLAALGLPDPRPGRHGVPAAPRLTRQREAVLTVLREATAAGESLGVDELYQRARTRTLRLSRSTVARTLATLAATGDGVARSAPRLPVDFDAGARAAQGARSVEAHRWTRQRRLVQRVLEAGEPPETTEDLVRSVRALDPDVTRGTVVRALVYLREHGSARAAAVVLSAPPARAGQRAGGAAPPPWSRRQQAVLDVLREAREALDAQRLRRRARRRDGQVGVGTVYQALATLLGRGLVVASPHPTDSDAPTRYALAGPGRGPDRPGVAAAGRHVLVCRVCGATAPLDRARLRRLHEDLQLHYPFRLAGAEHEVRALCDACAAADRTDRPPGRGARAGSRRPPLQQSEAPLASSCPFQYHLPQQTVAKALQQEP